MVIRVYHWGVIRFGRAPRPAPLAHGLELMKEEDHADVALDFFDWLEDFFCQKVEEAYDSMTPEEWTVFMDDHKIRALALINDALRFENHNDIAKWANGLGVEDSAIIGFWLGIARLYPEGFKAASDEIKKIFGVPDFNTYIFESFRVFLKRSHLYCSCGGGA